MPDFIALFLISHEDNILKNCLYDSANHNAKTQQEYLGLINTILEIIFRR